MLNTELMLHLRCTALCAELGTGFAGGNGQRRILWWRPSTLRRLAGATERLVAAVPLAVSGPGACARSRKALCAFEDNAFAIQNRIEILSYCFNHFISEW